MSNLLENCFASPIQGHLIKSIVQQQTNGIRICFWMASDNSYFTINPLQP